MGSQKIFQKLCSTDDPSGVASYITQDSFDQGLHNLGLDIREAECQQLFDNMNRDKKG